MVMWHIDLFSGIGGFSLACEWAGVETIGFCEIDSFCHKVLKKHWPKVPIVRDVNNVEGIKKVIAHAEGLHGLWRTASEGQPVQQLGGCYSLLLTAGFPCQPFSTAGRRKGSADDRYLWPQTLTVIEAAKPDWVLLENVAGLLSMVFPDSAVGVASQASFCEVPNDEIADYDTISGGIERDLRQAGYETVWLVIPACAVNAPHRRDRIWIVAYSNGITGRQVRTYTTDGGERPEPNNAGQTDSDAANTQGVRRMVCGHTNGSNTGIPSKEVKGRIPVSCPDWSEHWPSATTRLCRMDDGISDRMDRLKALGGSIVPQVAYQIIKAIVETESMLVSRSKDSV